MPRQARIDIPGQIYHVMSRGIERRAIFHDEEDYAEFRDRIAEWVRRTEARCLAWCLMPNHFHFVILRGTHPLSEIMHQAMTGYAVHFNHKYHRAGHLFQNRYKAILCTQEDYLLELVPYIHLNPLRAQLVQDLAGLENYKWCGHGSAVTARPDRLMDRCALLQHYGSTEQAAVIRYEHEVAEKASAGAVMPRLNNETAADTGTLEDSDPAGSVTTAIKNRPILKMSRAEVLVEVEEATGIARQDILRRTRERGPASARAVYCHLAMEKAGSSVTELAMELRITPSAASKLSLRGRCLAGRGEIVQ